MSEGAEVPEMADEAESVTKDFDILSPPKRNARIGGVIVDVSFIPAKIAFRFIQFSKTHKVDALTANPEDFDGSMLEDIVDIIALICQRSSAKITKDWLMENIDMGVLIEFMKFVFQPLIDRVTQLNGGGIVSPDMDPGQAAGEGAAEAKN
jgi:hypothetical protein